jgi:hypothetical protein
MDKVGKAVHAMHGVVEKAETMVGLKTKVFAPHLSMRIATIIVPSTI